jgi:hypothetical protein
MTQEVVSTYSELFNIPLSYATEGIRDARFPIEGYDGLTVEEVSARLGSLSAEELREVRDYEEGNKNRETVLEQLDRRIRGGSYEAKTRSSIAGGHEGLQGAGRRVGQDAARRRVEDMVRGAEDWAPWRRASWGRCWWSIRPRTSTSSGRASSRAPAELHWSLRPVQPSGGPYSLVSRT